MSQDNCSNCGEPLKEYAIVCSNCGMPAKKQETHEKEEPASDRTEENKTEYTEHVYGEKVPKPNQQKNQFLAVIFSFFIPGLGQVYNGDFWKGVLFMIAVPIGTLLLIIPGIAILIYGMYDAYKEAEKINNGEKPYKDATVWEIIIFLLLPFIVSFGFVFLVSLLFIGIAVPLSVMV